MSAACHHFYLNLVQYSQIRWSLSATRTSRIRRIREMKSTGAESVRSEVLELDSRACSSKSAISFPTIGPFHDDTIPLASSTSEPVPRSSTSNNNVDLSPPTVLTGRQKLIRLCIVGSTLATVVLVQMLYVWGTIFDLGTRISSKWLTARRRPSLS